MAMRDPPRPWLWPRHTTHDGTRSDRRGGWTRRETGGRRSRGRGRMRTRGFRKCASSIRLEKSCCVSTAARLLSMTRPGLLCVSIKKEFRSNRPRPEGGARRPPALRRQERKSARARNGKRQFYVRSNFRTFTWAGCPPDVHSGTALKNAIDTRALSPDDAPNPPVRYSAECH